MEDNLNFFSQMEDQLSFFLQMQYNLNFGMEDNLIIKMVVALIQVTKLDIICGHDYSFPDLIITSNLQ